MSRDEFGVVLLSLWQEFCAATKEGSTYTDFTLDKFMRWLKEHVQHSYGSAASLSSIEIAAQLDLLYRRESVLRNLYHASQARERREAKARSRQQEGAGHDGSKRKKPLNARNQ